MFDKLERPRLVPPGAREPAPPAHEPPPPRSLAPAAAAVADAAPPPVSSRAPVQQSRAQRLAPGYRPSPTVAGARAAATAAVQPTLVGEPEGATGRDRAPERSRAVAAVGNPPPAAGGGRGPSPAPEHRSATAAYQMVRGAPAARAKPAAPPAARVPARGYATTRGTLLGLVAPARAAPVQRKPAAGRAGYAVSAGPPLAPLLAVLPVQAKVEIGATDDPLEHEADRVAETVTSSPPPPGPAPHGSSTPPTTSGASPEGAAPACACGTCASCMSKAGGGGAQIQRKAAPGADGGEAGVAVAAEPGAGVEMGEPMAPDVRARVEPVVGADLSGVRVHGGGGAAAAADSIGARAFTHGNHIWLGAGESARDHRLLAHEATHVVQQAGGAPASVQRDGGDDSWWDKASAAVGGVVSSVEEMGADAIIALVRRISPTVADLISQGPGPLIKNAITSAVQSFLGSLGLGGADLGSAWSTITTAFSADTIAGLFAGKGGSCDAFIAGIDALRDLGSRFMNSPAVKGVEAFFSTVNDIVTKIGTFVFAPAFDVLKSILGTAWDAISAVGKTIWEGLKAIKDAAGQAFDWVAKQLGFSSATGEDGLTDWIGKKASEIWESIKTTIQPIIGPLKIVGGAIAMLTGVGELYLIIKYAPKVVQAVQWLWAHKNDPNIVKSAHEQMGDTILPQLLEAGQGIAGTLETAFAGFLAKLTALGKGLLELVGAVTGVPLLSMVQGFIQTVSNGVQRAIAWASEFVSSAVTAIKSGVQKLYAFVKPYIPVLMSLAAAITNPAMIPVILAGWAWLALPDCVKPPIIDLLLDAVISVLSATPDLALLGLLWPIVKAGVLGFLQKVRALAPKDKISITNKLATIMTGSSPRFLLGFVVGVLKGLWMLVVQPFQLVWQMASGIVKLADWLGGTVEDFFTPAKDKKKTPPGAATKPGAAGSSAAKPSTATPPAPQGAGAATAPAPRATPNGPSAAAFVAKPKVAVAPAPMKPDEALLDARKRDSESVANAAAASVTPDNVRATVAGVAATLKAHRASEPPATAGEAHARAKASPSSTEPPVDTAAAVSASMAASGAAAGAPTPQPTTTATPPVAAPGPAAPKHSGAAKPGAGGFGAQVGKMGEQLKPPASKVASGFMPAVQQFFQGGGKSMSLDDLVGYLGKLWSSVLDAAKSAGAKIAEMVTKLFLGEEAEDTLGNAVGQAVAMIAGQAILDFFTGGLFEAVPILEEILEAPAEMLEEVFGLLKELGSYVVEGVKDIGSMVSEAGGALGEMMGSLTEIGEDLIKFGEELLADLGILGEEAAAGEAAVAEAGSAASAAEAGAAEMSAAEKAAAEAKAAEEAAAAEEKAAQEAEEAGEEAEKQAQNESEEKAEQEELEHEEAAAAAHVLAAEEEAAHVPSVVATLALDELKAKFEWIDHFEVEPAGAGVDLVMIGSRVVVYVNYKGDLPKSFTMADEPETDLPGAEESLPGEGKPTDAELELGGGEEALSEAEKEMRALQEEGARHPDIELDEEMGPPELEPEQELGETGEGQPSRRETEASQFEPPEKRAEYVQDTAGETAVQKIEREAVPPDLAEDAEELAKERQALLEEARSAAEAGDEAAANAARAEAIKVSEDLGTHAGSVFGQELEGQGFEHALTGEGSRTFDQVYVRPPDEVAILETKGASSGLGTRWDAAGEKRVEQGTTEYIEAVLNDLKDKEPDLVDQIRAAMENDKLRYFEVRQPVTADGALKAIEVKEFAL